MFWLTVFLHSLILYLLLLRLGYKYKIQINKIQARICHLLSPRAWTFLLFYQRMFEGFLLIETHHSVTASLQGSKTSGNLSKELVSPHVRVPHMTWETKEGERLALALLTAHQEKEARLASKATSQSSRCHLDPSVCSFFWVLPRGSAPHRCQQSAAWAEAETEETFKGNQELLIPVTRNSSASSLCTHADGACRQGAGSRGRLVLRLWFGSILFAKL